MMEPNNQEKASARPTLFIDLNEIPVLSTPSPHARPYPDIVSESESYKAKDFVDVDQNPFLKVNIGFQEVCVPACGACGGPEAKGLVVVCDGCERGFHLACAGLEEERETSAIADWLCSGCHATGVFSKRWPLGVKDKRTLDINCSPPSDIDTEAPELLLVATGKKFPAKRMSGAEIEQSFTVYKSNDHIAGFQNLPDVYKLDLQSACKTEESENRNLDVIGLSHGRVCSGADAGRQSSHCEILLGSLRQFVSERNGVLEDGWRVEVKFNDSNNEKSVTYFSPDEKIFGSMAEVALHLGLVDCILDGCSTSYGSDLSGRIKLPKKRKSRQCAAASGFSENKEYSWNDIGRDSLSNTKHVNETNLCDRVLGGDISSDLSSKALPVQFEDYYIFSVGRIDPRPAYHEPSVIWPVEFKSVWHDKITRSLFVCEVLEGGDEGPLFKIQRVPCSASPIPNVCTVVQPSNIAMGTHEDGETAIGRLCCNMGIESDDNIEVILSRKSPPNEFDVSSCLHDRMESGMFETSFCDYVTCDSSCDDEIGELSVEESSSTLAWKLIAQKLVNSLRNLCTKGRDIKFLCKHVDHNYPLWVIEDHNNKGVLHPLTKFCSYPCYFNVPIVPQRDLDPLSCNLLQWLEEDRFGLNCEFVQEIVEQLLDVEACSKYQPLVKRFQSSEVLTVASHRLVVKNCNKESVCMFDDAKKPKLANNTVMHEQFHPCGNLLLTKVPVKLVGDLYQVWEILRRFHKVLGIEELFSLDQLEAEIVQPCLDGLNISENCRKFSQNHVPDYLHNNDHIKVTDSSSCNLVSGSEDHYLRGVENVAKTAVGNRLPFMTDSQYVGIHLSKAHSSLANVLTSELQSKVTAAVNPNSCLRESKPRKGRRKDVDYSILEWKNKINLLPINDLTWPEFVRRYLLSFITIGGNLDSQEIIARESSRVYCCLGGDGGVLCGSLPGVAGMEADALLLADATKQIFGTLSAEPEILMVEDESNFSVDCEKYVNGAIPEWAQLLEPVKKLPTNVGTRIRKCVQDALEKCPPDWAKKRLEHCISKEIYKGNASGPTKKAVLAVLAEVLSEGLQTTLDKTNKKMVPVPISDVIMKWCRIVLRQAASVDEDKMFCTLLGRIISASGDHSDEGLLGSPAFVSRPLDFRIIDHRLVAGAYSGSYESFVEDVRQLCSNVHIAFSDQSDVIDLADKVFKKFESLYETEVLALVRMVEDYCKLDQMSDDIKNKIKERLVSSDNIPKAPWDEGLCKVCGIDRDDESVLLCDSCDAEYHTYCLVPPLARIPQGNWYCPSCTPENHEFPAMAQVLSHGYKMYEGESVSDYLKQIRYLADAMEEKEYWDLSINERINLLRFLSDELLNSALIRQHLELCSETAAELQQKLRVLYNDLKNLTSKEEFLSSTVERPDIVTDESKGRNILPFPKQSKPQIVSGLDINDEKCCCSQKVVPLVTANDQKQQNNVSNKKNSELRMLCTVHEACEGDAGCLRKSNTSRIPSLDEQGSQDNHIMENTASAALDEFATKKDELLKLQKSIQKFEYELLAVSLRREYLGSDSEGRLYWASVTVDNSPLIIVNAALSWNRRNHLFEAHQEFTSFISSHLNMDGRKTCFPYCCDSHYTATTCSWIFYQNNAEIQNLLWWLKDHDTNERVLKESIVQWMHSRFLEHPNCKNLNKQQCMETLCAITSNGDIRVSNNLHSRASMILEKRYGVFLEPDPNDILSSGRTKRSLSDEKLYRCVCLEPIWHSRYHCISCHRTFTNGTEFECHHNCNCPPHTWTSEVVQGTTSFHTTVKVSQNIGFDKASRLCKSGPIEAPFDFEDIISKFRTQDSIKDVVYNIGLLGSHGIPALLSSPLISETSLLLVSSNNDDNFVSIMSDGFKDYTACPADRVINTHCGVIHNHISQKSTTATDNGKKPVIAFSDGRQKVSSDGNMNSINCYSIIPSSSLRPVIGQALQMFRQLKINLLDMEAALSNEAFRLSKAQIEKKWAWRAYVKSASSIYQMVLATILLEEMINSQFLRNEWWYWSSLTAAAKMSTVSSLAMRIYALDAAILYEKDFNIPNSITVDEYRVISDSTGKCRINRKSNRKRKAEG